MMWCCSAYANRPGWASSNPAVTSMHTAHKPSSVMCGRMYGASLRISRRS